MEEPLVSVIVPTKNSEKTLGACLGSIARQSYPNVEIIVVDNNSTDSTTEIAGQYADKVYQFGPERSAQRNYGAEHAGGEYLLFPDSDMVLTRDVVKSCVEVACDNPEVAGLVIPEESIGTGFWSECRKLEKIFYKGVDWMEAARFFKSDMFLEMGGYDLRNTGTEDYDLPQRVKACFGTTSISRVNEVVYHDERTRSLVESCRTKFYYGHDLSAYRSVEANKDNLRKQQSLLKRYGLFFSDPRMLFRNPFLGLGLLFMKLCDFGSWGAGFMAVRLQARLKR